MQKLFFFVALFSLSTAAFADTIWEAHSKPVAAEQTTDFQVAPVANQLMRAGQHTDATLAAAADARMRLESARHEFMETFEKLSAAEKEAFLQELSKRPTAEILIYDFDPISTQLPRIAEIREQQKQDLYFPFGPSGRTLEPVIKPRQLPTASVTIDTANTREINGNGFAANNFSLTFDDGPLPRTSRPILATLKEWGVKVNYFQCGNMVAALSGNDANLLAEQYQDGHLIENHSWNHPQMSKMTVEAAKQQIEDTYSVIERNLSAFHYRSPLFRFPYGDRNQALLDMTHNMGVTSIMWNIDTLDWKYLNPSDIVDITRPQIQQQGKGIILMHEIHTQTTLALPSVLQILSDRNATLVQLRPTNQ